MPGVARVIGISRSAPAISAAAFTAGASSPVCFMCCRATKKHKCMRAHTCAQKDEKCTQKDKRGVKARAGRAKNPGTFARLATPSRRSSHTQAEQQQQQHQECGWHAHPGQEELQHGDHARDLVLVGRRATVRPFGQRSLIGRHAAGVLARAQLSLSCCTAAVAAAAAEPCRPLATNGVSRNPPTGRSTPAAVRQRLRWPGARRAASNATPAGCPHPPPCRLRSHAVLLARPPPHTKPPVPCFREGRWPLF